MCKLKLYFTTKTLILLLISFLTYHSTCQATPTCPDPPKTKPPHHHNSHVPKPPSHKPKTPAIKPPHKPRPPIVHPKPPVVNPPVIPKPPVVNPPVIPTPPIVYPPVIPNPPIVPNPPVVVTPSPPQEPPCPPPPPPAKEHGTCPIDTLTLGACVDVLGGLVHIGIGSKAKDKCCPVLGGLLGLDAAICLCDTIKLKLLNINIVLPIALQVLIDCGKTPPEGFKCSA